MPMNPLRQQQRGSSLIEVLVAILVTSVGMLAMAGVVGVASRLAKTSGFRGDAAILANEMADRMRANIGGAYPGNANYLDLVKESLAAYSHTPADLSDVTAEALTPCADVNQCTQPEIARIDLDIWLKKLREKLPKGSGHILINDIPSADGAKMIDLWVMWEEPDALVGSEDSSWGQYFNSGDNVGHECPPDFNSEKARCFFLRVGL